MMTAAEFAAARERLGLSVEQVAAELHLAPSVVAAWERGDLKVPRDTAALLAWRAALAEQEAVLAASGLPECPVAAELDRAAVAAVGGDAFDATAGALAAHADGCPACQARAAHLERHAPPLPELPVPRWARAVAWAAGLGDRLPPGLRPPAGEAGEGRRMGLLIAAAFSALAAAVVAVGFVALVATVGWPRLTWRDAAALPVIVTGYIVGFFLAGAAFDATRSIRHRFGGYVLRGALAAGAIYGTIGLAMPLIDSEARLGDVPLFAGLFAAFGAVAGAVLWIRARLTGKLPPRAA